MQLLLSRGENIAITEEVVKATAGNRWNSKEMIRLLLGWDKNIVITERAVKAAA